MNGTQAAKRQTPYKYYRWPVPCQTMRANRQAGQHQGRGPSNFGTHAAEGEQDAPADRDGLWRVLPLWPRRQTRITFADCLRGDAFSVSKVFKGLRAGAPTARHPSDKAALAWRVSHRRGAAQNAVPRPAVPRRTMRSAGGLLRVSFPLRSASRTAAFRGAVHRRVFGGGSSCLPRLRIGQTNGGPGSSIPGDSG